MSTKTIKKPAAKKTVKKKAPAKKVAKKKSVAKKVTKTIAQPPEGTPGKPTVTDDRKREAADKAEKERLAQEAIDMAPEDAKHPLFGKYKCFPPQPDDIAHDGHHFTLEIEHGGNLYRFAIAENILRPHEAARYLDMRLEKDDRVEHGHVQIRHGTS